MKHPFNNYSVDIFIQVTDYNTLTYKVVNDFNTSDLNVYKLQFSFENSTDTFNDEQEHIYFTACYINEKGKDLVKFKDEDFGELICKVYKWNLEHKHPINDTSMLQIGDKVEDGFGNILEVSKIKNENDERMLYLTRFNGKIKVGVWIYSNGKYDKNSKEPSTLDIYRVIKK